MRLMRSKGFKAALLSTMLLSFINACADREFKGGTASRTMKKANDAVPDTSPSGDAVPEADPKEPVDVVTDELKPGEDLEVPRVVSKVPPSLSASFKASSNEKAAFEFSLDTKSASTSFKLADVNAAKSQSHKQNTRQLISESYSQGTAGNIMKQTFEQKGQKGLVDILVVVDNSGSMDAEQKNLSDKLSALLKSISGSNWQIGVITTTVQAADACKMTLIKSTDTDYEAKFRLAVQPGINGSGQELGIKQAVIGLGCKESPWLRPDASTAVLIVSDADNCTNDGADCGSEPWAKEQYLINYVEGTLNKEVWKNAGFYGIYSSQSAPCGTAEKTGIQYDRLMAYRNSPEIRKNRGNICDADYSVTLNQISADIALLLKNQFELSAAPDSGSLKLSVDGNPIPATDYKISGKTITFVEGRQPANGKILTTDYVVGATPRFKELNLKNDPALETLSVKVSGKTLAANAYTISGRKLVFASQPADLAPISIDYRIAGELVNAFQLEKSPLANSLKVTVNGAAASGMTYDAAKNQIVFNPIPADGAAVEINYNYRVGPQLVYSVPTQTGSSNHKVFDGANEIAHTKSGDNFTIKAENFAVGKTLTVKFDAPDGSARTFDLPNAPIADTITFTKDIPSCKVGAGISVSGSRVSANCPVTAKSDFEMTYFYNVLHDSFSLDVPNPDVGIWEVSVDGKAFSEYKREGNAIKIDHAKYLKLDSLIEIRYTFPE